MHVSSCLRSSTSAVAAGIDLCPESRGAFLPLSRFGSSPLPLGSHLLSGSDCATGEPGCVFGPMHRKELTYSHLNSIISSAAVAHCVSSVMWRSTLEAYYSGSRFLFHPFLPCRVTSMIVGLSDASTLLAHLSCNGFNNKWRGASWTHHFFLPSSPGLATIHSRGCSANLPAFTGYYF